MGILFFKLSNVPEDEADDVRRLLEENGIDYYETHAGFFGTSVAALWLQSEEQRQQARDLLDEYQCQRSERERRDYASRKSAGEVETLWVRVKREPVKVVLGLAVVLVILYLSVVPFVRLILT